MTKNEAHAEARKRYGAAGSVWHDYGVGTPYCVVGVRVGDRGESMGSGDSWEAAFLDADRREGGER